MENKLATRVNLSRRGVLVESLMCCLCGKEEESCSNLFFDCSFTWRVWSLCFRWLGVLFLFHIGLKSNFDGRFYPQSRLLLFGIQFGLG